MPMLALCCLLLAGANPDGAYQRAIMHMSITHALMTEDAINWAVGDTASYNLSTRYGKGTMVQSVTKDEGASLWMRQAFKLRGQAQILDVQLNKADGKILKMLENGQETDIPEDEELEILSADERKVTVPAGTFACIHVVARQKDGHRLESWMNPEDTVMDGTLKQVVGTDMGNIVLELVSFKRGSA